MLEKDSPIPWQAAEDLFGGIGKFVKASDGASTCMHTSAPMEIHAGDENRFYRGLPRHDGHCPEQLGASKLDGGTH